MAVLGRVVIYARDLEAMVAFYCGHFGFEVRQVPGDRIVELMHPDGGAAILLHPAGKAQKMGQVLVKLVFDVEDVPGFVAGHPVFGVVHQADGYCFANGKDPSGNSVQVSSRAFVARS